MEAGGASRAAVQVPGATPGRPWFGDPQVRVRDEASNGVVREPWKGAGLSEGQPSSRSQVTPITPHTNHDHAGGWAWRLLGKPCLLVPTSPPGDTPSAFSESFTRVHLTVSYYGVTDVHGTWLLTSGAAGSAIQCEGALGSKAAEAGKGIPGGRTACAKVQSPERTRRVGERGTVRCVRLNRA